MDNFKFCIFEENQPTGCPSYNDSVSQYPTRR